MIAIPVKADPSNPLNSRASKLFGNAPAFVLISQEGTSSILANDFANGKQLAQALINSGVKTLITNHLGEKPYQMLTAASVQIKYDTLSDTAAAALAALRQGQLQQFQADMAKDKKHQNHGNAGGCNSNNDSDCDCGGEHGSECGSGTARQAQSGCKTSACKKGNTACH